MTDKISTTFFCDICKQEITQEHYSLTTGYGIDKDGHKACYTCCANFDREDMIKHGNAMLYLANGKITNWPGSLSFDVKCKWTGWHNWGLKVYFARFIGPDGKVWSGKTIGDNTEIFHCKRTKLTSCYAD